MRRNGMTGSGGKVKGAHAVHGDSRLWKWAVGICNGPGAV